MICKKIKYLNNKKHLVVVIAFLTIAFFTNLFSSYRPNHSTKKLTHENIDRVYVLNMDRSVERRKEYESLLTKYFDGKLFGKNFQEIRFKCTDAKFTIIVKDMKTGEKIDGVEFLKGNRNFEFGRLYHIYDKQEPDFVVKYRPNKNGKRLITMGEIGATMSHLRALRDVVRNEYSNSIIFEDDFVFFKPESFYEDFDKMLENTPRDYDLIKFDIFNAHGNMPNPYVRFREKIKSYFTNGTNKYLNKQNGKKFWMMSSYMISYTGAKKILQFVENNIFDEHFWVIDELIYSEARWRGLNLNLYYAKNPLVTQTDVVADARKSMTSEVDKLSVEFKNESEYRFKDKIKK